jgi:hypothetical protein
LIAFALAFSWGFCLLMSLVGWGGALNRLLFRNHRADWGQRAGWGLSFSICLGGVLNLSCGVSRVAVLLFLAIGLITYVLDTVPSRVLRVSFLVQRARELLLDKPLAAGTLLVLTLIIVQYAGSVSGGQHPGAVSASNFNAHDDFQAYFVYPTKMLQTGCMGPDPFSERRANTSLGGQSFLHTFVLSALPAGSLHLIDPGLGLLISVGLILGHLARRKVSPRAGALVLFLLALLPPPTANISALMVGFALFVTLFRTLEWPGFTVGAVSSRAAIVAFVAAALCAAKSSFIPAAGLFVVVSYASYFLTTRRRMEAVLEVLVAGTVTGLLLVPWMVSLQQSSGTLLYPLLGKGVLARSLAGVAPPFEALSAGRAVSALASTARSAPFIVVALIGLVRVRSKAWRAEERAQSLSFWVSALGASIVVSLLLAGFPTGRFMYPFLVSAAVIFIAAEAAPRLRPTSRPFALGVLCASLLLVTSWHDSLMRYGWALGGVRLGLRAAPLVTTAEASRYASVQGPVPAGDTILARLEKPFLLDFRRNTIFIIDWPGGASLPPGMPMFQGRGPLADYLGSKSIRYVAYSYAQESGFSKAVFGARLNSGVNAWERAHARYTFDFQDNLQQLGRARKRVYDDGDIFVLDVHQGAAHRDRLRNSSGGR